MFARKFQESSDGLHGNFWVHYKEVVELGTWNSVRNERRGFAAVILWRWSQEKKKGEPQQVEFLVFDTARDPVRSSDLEPVESRLKRLPPQLKQRRFPGDYSTPADERLLVPLKVKKSFTAQGLAAYTYATLSRVLAQSTGLVLGRVEPKPVFINMVEQYHSMRYFLVGPNDKGAAWSGALRENPIVVPRHSGGVEIFCPAQWVTAKELSGKIAEGDAGALHAAMGELAKRFPKLRPPRHAPKIRAERRRISEVVM